MKNLPTIKQTSTVVLSKTRNLMTITNKILTKKGEISIQDDSWIERLWAWADDNLLRESNMVFDKDTRKTYYQGIPKTKEDLLLVEHITLRWNRLQSLSNEICELKNLKVLELMNNRLETLPKNIANLTQLETLDLNINQLIELPPSIIKLKRLKFISIRNNKSLFLTENHIEWLKTLIEEGCVVQYDKNNFNLGE